MIRGFLLAAVAAILLIFSASVARPVYAAAETAMPLRLTVEVSGVRADVVLIPGWQVEVRCFGHWWHSSGSAAGRTGLRPTAVPGSRPGPR